MAEGRPARRVVEVEVPYGCLDGVLLSGAPSSAKLMVLIEELTRLEDKQRSIEAEAERLRERALWTVEPLICRWLDTNSAGLIVEVFRGWLLAVDELKAEKIVDGLDQQFQAELLRGQKEAAQFHAVIQQEKDKAAELQSLLAREQDAAEMYAAEVTAQKRRHDLLREQLSDAERCILKLQGVAQETAEIVRHDALEYGAELAASKESLGSTQADVQHLTTSVRTTTTNAGAHSPHASTQAVQSPPQPAASPLPNLSPHRQYVVLSSQMPVLLHHGPGQRSLSPVQGMVQAKLRCVSPQQVVQQRSVSPQQVVQFVQVKEAEIPSIRSLSPPIARPVAAAATAPWAPEPEPALSMSGSDPRSPPLVKESEAMRVIGEAVRTENTMLQSKGLEILVETMHTQQRSASPANPYQRVVQRSAQNVEGVAQTIQRVYMNGPGHTVQTLSLGTPRVPAQMQAPGRGLQRPRSQEVASRPRARPVQGAWPVR